MNRPIEKIAVRVSGFIVMLIVYVAMLIVLLRKFTDLMFMRELNLIVGL